MKDEECVINLDEHYVIATHWIALNNSNNNVTYFDRFRVEHISKEIEKFINKSTIVANVCRLQAYDSVMCEYFCIGFIDFIFEIKSLTDFTNLFSPNDFKKKKKGRYSFKLFFNYFLISVESIEDNSDETPDLNNQQFILNKKMKSKSILLERLRKED